MLGLTTTTDTVATNNSNSEVKILNQVKLNYTNFQQPAVSYNTLPAVDTIATTFLNDTWFQVENFAAALIASTNTWLDNNMYPTITNNSISVSPPAISYNNPSLNMPVTEISFSYGGVGSRSSSSSSISVGSSMPDVARIFENFLNLTTTTSTMSIANASDFIDDAEVTATATETPYVPYVMRPETYIVPVIFAIIFIVGVLGNGTLIIVFLTVRQMRNIPNIFIFSLALADLLVIVTTVPLTSTVYTVDSWPWGSFLCTLSEFFKDVSIGVSVFTLTALAANRYFAIVDPLRKFHAHGGGKRATRMTSAIAISIWLLAILCSMPALMGTYVKIVEINSNKSFSVCYPFPEKWGEEYAKIMVLLRFLVYYAIPLVIIGIFYVLIALHLMYAANVPGEMHGAVRQVRARRKVALTVLAFVVIFGICFLPIHVFMLWFYYCPTAQEDYNYFWHVFRIVGFCMSFANSCANPVALYFVSGAFRKHFNRYLFCKGSRTICKQRDTSLTTSRRYYYSKRSCFRQSTLRSRLQETTITMLTNGCNNTLGGGGAGGNGIMTSGISNCTPDDPVDVALTSDYCHQHQHSHQLM